MEPVPTGQLDHLGGLIFVDIVTDPAEGHLLTFLLLLCLLNSLLLILLTIPLGLVALLIEFESSGENLQVLPLGPAGFVRGESQVLIPNPDFLLVHDLDFS